MSSAAPLRPTRVDAFVLRWPVATPVRTSFGVMHDRPMLLLRVEDADGAHGWGEAWCNFPSCGAEHRARLVETVLAPLLCDGTPFASPADAFASLTERSAVLALQSGEPGPIAQAIAGLDLALWDLQARRAGQPLWALLGAAPAAAAALPVYASGLNPVEPQLLAARMQAQGYTAFKLKVGFGEARDLANLRALRDTLGPEARLMVDANQAWDLATARRMAERLAPFDLGWLEEPLRADRPWSEWQALAQHGAPPLAAGENVAGDAGFDALLACGAVGVVQPDIAKWGGLSATLPVIRRVQAAGARYCPHYLGGGVGLLHSAHLLAAAGGDGLLEIDANDNPLRSELCPPLAALRDGRIALGDAPGIGIDPDPRALQARCDAARS